MEFLALAIWLLVAGTGAILLRHAVTTPEPASPRWPVLEG